MEFILVTAKILILLSGILFSGLFVERHILQKYEANLYISFLLGISIIYGMTLLGLKLSNIIIYIFAVNLIGFYRYYKIIFKIRINKYILIISLPVIIAICFQMIWYWDAVVLWFFHAKIIVFEGMFPPEKFTGTPMSSYPKMLPTIAALVSEITSVHNEALPKTALAFLMFGIILGFNEVKYFNIKEKIFIYFVLLSLMGIHSYSGYMDGWLAIYTAICCIFMVNLKKENDERHAANIISTIFFLPMMKLEGQVIAFILLLFFVIGNHKLIIDNHKKLLLLSFILIAPTAIWVYLKHKHDIVYLTKFQDMGDRLFHRLEFDLVSTIYHLIIFSNLIYILIMPLFILILIKLNAVSLNNYVWLPLKISTIYLICVMGIFLTNHAAMSQLHEFTTRRITMPIMMMLFIFNLMILKELNVFYKFFERKKDLKSKG